MKLKNLVLILTLVFGLKLNAQVQMPAFPRPCGYVDTNCIAGFGHSRGAWTTVAMVGLHPHKFSVAAHTAGEIYDNVNSVSAKSYMAMGITAPYQMHHGDNDNTVYLSQDISLDSVLNITAVTHTLIVYPGYTHSQIAQDSLMYVRTKAWFNQ